MITWSVPPLDFLKPGTGGASRAKNVRASSNTFCVAFPGNCTRTCIQRNNWHDQIKSKDSTAEFVGAHINLFIVAGYNGRLDVLQRQIALPVGLSDRWALTCTHFLKTLAISETLNHVKCGSVLNIVEELAVHLIQLQTPAGMSSFLQLKQATCEGKRGDWRLKIWRWQATKEPRPVCLPVDMGRTLAGNACFGVGMDLTGHLRVEGMLERINRATDELNFREGRGSARTGRTWK